MRADIEPWSDNRLRQALMKCLDRQKILDLSYFGQGELAHDTHIAPIHPEYCQKPIPAYDPEGAKALLAEAGHADGLTVELTAPEAMAGPAMAQSLKESAAAGGINIEIKSIPASLYWDVWTEVPLGITHWTHLALGTMAFDLAYVADQDGAPSAWNETHWVDEEFSELLRQADRTLDIEARRAIMCQLEDIQMSRGSVGIPFWANLWYICRDTFKNVKAHPSSYDVLNEVWYEPEES
jgi:peptide/nickel transport system substrate-binding protein